MSSFYAQICEMGHIRIDYKRVRDGAQCETCGAQVIDSCPACGQLIKKWHYYGSVPRGPIAAQFKRPDRCQACGAVFPWAEE